MLVRREALESAGCFDERFFMYSDETDLCRRIKTAGWEIRHVPQMTILHHDGKAGVKPHIESLGAVTRMLYARKYFCPRTGCYTVRRDSTSRPPGHLRWVRRDRTSKTSGQPRGRCDAVRPPTHTFRSDHEPRRRRDRRSSVAQCTGTRPAVAGSGPRRALIPVAGSAARSAQVSHGGGRLSDDAGAGDHPDIPRRRRAAAG